MSKTKTFQFRCSEEELAQLKQAAGPVPVSAWARDVLLEASAPQSGVAQPVAREAHNLEVAGSSPAPASDQAFTTKSQELGKRLVDSGKMVVISTAVAPKDCSNAPFHKAGVYCKRCGSVA